MSFFKSKTFIFSSVILSTAAVVGIGTGVGLSIKNKQTNNFSTSFANKEETTNLKTLIDSINKDSFVVYDLDLPNKNPDSETEANESTSDIKTNEFTKEVSKTSLYAFDVAVEQLKLKTNINLGENISYEINLDKAKNNPASLNQGNLNISLKLIDSTNNQFETKDIVIDNFKKPSDELIKLLDSSDASLTITPKDENKYVNLEHLNSQLEISSGIVPPMPQADLMKNTEVVMSLMSGQKEDEDEFETIRLSGLSLWFNESIQGINNIDRSISIQGSVKLEKVNKKQNKTQFILKSSEESTALKLIKKSGKDIISEALISEIKTNNLLATDLTVVSTKSNNQDTKTYIDNLKKEHVSLGYLKDHTNPYLNKELAINLQNNRRNKPADLLFVNPEVISEKLTQNKNTLPFQLILSFGSGKETKRYNTNNAYDLEELKAAGFGFSFYAKQLTDTDEKLNSSKINDASNKLNLFFKTQNYAIASEQKKPMPEDNSQPKKVDGDFYLTTYKNDQLTKEKPFEILFDKSSDDEMTSLAKKQETQNQNLLVFADYSYSGIKENNVLFTPSISLIHIKTTKQN